MALVIKDRVKETTTTTGTGTYTLAGAVSGFETFTANLSNSDTTYYVCTDNTDFEVGLGTFTSSGTTLARTTILASSNSNNAVNWSSGTRSVFMTYPADKAVFEDASNNINGTFVGNITGNVTGNTSGTAATVTGAAQTNITSVGTLSSLATSGDITVGDDLFVSGGLIDLKNDGAFVSQIKFYCESSNQHAQTLIGAPHSESASNTLTLPSTGGNARLVTTASTATLTNKTFDVEGTGNSISNIDVADLKSGVLDTDISSVSGSDDTLASAKAIKTYVDAQVTAQDLDVVSDSGTIAIDLDSETLTIAGGTGLASSASSNTVTLAVDAAQTGITSLLATDIKIGEDDQTKIDFETADTINFYAGNEKQLVLTNGALTPGTNAIVDLGTDALEFKDAYFDGTVEADAITIGGTALAEVISDTTGAMFSSNTETGITVTYQDADNTIDVVIDAAQTTITSLLATDIKIGEDDQTKIDFETADTINFYAGNEKQLILTNGALTPGADNILDLGSSGVEFKDAFFDGTVTSDAFVGPLTGDVTGNADTASAVAADNISTGDAAVTIATSSGNITIDAQANNSDIIFKGTDGGVDITALTLDMSASGNAKFNNNVNLESDSSIIHFGTDKDVKLTHVHDTGLLLNSSMQLQFGDSGTYIHQSADGVLDLVSDTEIEINATTIDMNGNLDVSGTITSGGVITGTGFTIGSAVIAEAELEQLDGITAGTVAASKAVVVDANKDVASFRNVTLTGELDAATGDFSGDVDIDGTLEADAITVAGATLSSVIQDEATALAIALG